MSTFMINNQPISLKHLSLCVLCIQNSALAVLMRLARVGSSEKFNSATAVVLGEIFKVTACIFLVYWVNKCIFVAYLTCIE